MRSKLTYSNVVATLALFLVLTGGTVYAAVQLGKNDVKGRHIAKGAVKGKDLAADAVKGPKVLDGSIGAEDLAATVFEGLDVDVTGSARSGPRGALNTATSTALPLTGTTSFVPEAGEVGAIVAEGRFTSATTDPAQFCSPSVTIAVNGQPTRVFVSPEIEGNNTTLVTSLGRDADGPFGLVSPGTRLNLTAQIRGDADCVPGTRLDNLEVRIIQLG